MPMFVKAKVQIHSQFAHLTLFKWLLYSQANLRLIYLKLLNMRSKICEQSLSHSYFSQYYKIEKESRLSRSLI